MVTSKNRTTTSAKTGVVGLLFSAAVMIFVLLFGGTAGALEDQASTTDNSGTAVAASGNNGAAGNDSANRASGDQTATASGAGDQSAAPNQGGANNASTGSANVTTGDANATGNLASNNTQQTVVSGHNGAVVIVDQDATITNTGDARATTGGNTATGNTSRSVSTADQTATATGGVDGVATNTASPRNQSGGDARVTTGDATATGNTATNNVNQTFSGNYSGLGVVVIVDQNVDVTNSGTARANSGRNDAVGNESSNEARTRQDADASGSVAANNATPSTSSDGSAGIITGDATAVGNVATNNVSQIANVTATGTLGSIVIIDQNADVENSGRAMANTGLNTATGNLSRSTSNAVQGAVSGAGPPTSDSLAFNDGIATTSSDGTADIATGNASAVGNRSNTNLTQAINVNTTGNGFVLTGQTANVTNSGTASANTGGNDATGNDSRSLARVKGPDVLKNVADPQGASAITNLADDAVAANFGTASTHSNGSASISTGNADATGNVATTNISQTVNADTNGGLFLPEQDATVTNSGTGRANTGNNTATGNESRSKAFTVQDAVVGDADESAVASNFGEARSTTDGHATIGTGNADAIGNDSGATTNIAQTASANGSDFVLSGQTVNVSDTGRGRANTGGNTAIGNTSSSNARTKQVATANGTGDDSVATNFGSTLSSSDGSADITTGSATAVGSSSSTNIAQTVDANGSGLLISDQDATQSNFGRGNANTGNNRAIGNESTAKASVNQTAELDASRTGDNVAVNFGTSNTSSNGSASITTGSANAIGSLTSTNVAQTVDFSGDHFALVDQDVDASSTGRGRANTGNNTAIGNTSSGNTSSTNQTASVTETGRGRIGGRIVASNDAITNVNSDGDASITTGAANAVGNASHSTFAQTADVNTDNGFALVGQVVSEENTGRGIANSGRNLAVGNESDASRAGVRQTATVSEAGRGGIRADDIVAANIAITNVNSDGDASITTGAANAQGNVSTTSVAQTADANFTGNGFALYSQDADVDNNGRGVANSGRNAAYGNTSTNRVSPATQEASVTERGRGSIIADDIVATNIATTNVNSNGTARITTGNASAIGNDSASTTTINQLADATIGGGGFVLSDQTADVDNRGTGFANSGANLAVGNDSTTRTCTGRRQASCTQDASVSESGRGRILADDVVASNLATTNVVSNGSAEIHTGLAEGVGNRSTTNVNQVSDVNIAGGGFVIAEQTGDVTNEGVGRANTGRNAAFGNTSTTRSCSVRNPCTQEAEVEEEGRGNLVADDVAAVNIATFNNYSDGSATITTGDACAIGNESTTTLNQVIDADIAGSGFIIGDQVGSVTNSGTAKANSGRNVAVGNSSRNTAAFDQEAEVDEDGRGSLRAEDVVASNLAVTNNVSDGSASITTGCACAEGNISTTGINQVLNANIVGSGFVLTGQEADVTNSGLALANTGGNVGIGNDSTNRISSTQDAEIDGPVVLGDDAVAFNSTVGNNISNGRVDIDTGDAYALGNLSATGIAQAASYPGSGLFLPEQTDSITNTGFARAISGGNFATGNSSRNSTTFTANASAPGGVASNFAELNNVSDGLANVRTGDAHAIGNAAANSSCQGINVPVNCPVPALPTVPRCTCKRPTSTPPVTPPGIPPVTPPTPDTPVVPVPGGITPPGAVLARTGVAVGVQALLGLLLLAFGALLRRRARTA